MLWNLYYKIIVLSLLSIKTTNRNNTIYKTYYFLLLCIHWTGSLKDTLMNFIRKPHLKVHFIIIIIIFTSFMFRNDLKYKGRKHMKKCVDLRHVFCCAKIFLNLISYSCKIASWSVYCIVLCIVSSSLTKMCFGSGTLKCMKTIKHAAYGSYGNYFSILRHNSFYHT